MDAAGMNIRKWRSNDAQLDLQWAPNEMKQATVLGVKWNLKDDYLALNKLNLPSQVETKRDLMKLVASIYDPLGILLPYTVSFKLLLKQAWEAKLSWDVPLG